MQVFVVGLNHRTAPVQLRELMMIAERDLPGALQELKAATELAGVMATTTCNRFEIYAVAEHAQAAIESVSAWIAARVPKKNGEVLSALYSHLGQTAVQHIFRVASSLDSMVLGEAQILGQVKRAFATASQSGHLDSVLDRCMIAALRVAKKVRTHTGIARNPVSVPSVSVELARKVFGELRGRTAMLIGAGEVSALAAHHLSAHGMARTYIVNRTEKRAHELAKKLAAEVRPFEEMKTLLGEVDIAFTSTSAPSYILKKADVASILKKRRYRPLLIIDLAVPRDVDPKVGSLSNVYLFDVDDLSDVVDENLAERRLEARHAELIVAEEAERFLGALHADSVTPTIVRLRQRLMAIGDDEVDKAERFLNQLSDSQRAHVERLVGQVVKRILHRPSVALKELAQTGAGEDVADIVEVLFDLAESPPEGGP